MYPLPPRWNSGPVPVVPGPPRTVRHAVPLMLAGAALEIVAPSSP